VLEWELNKHRGEPITRAELADLTGLAAHDENIVDLTGLEHATGLDFLNLNKNDISDLSPLQGLPRLTNLRLGHNRIVDVSPLRDLTRLKYLHLDGNRIEDIAPLRGMTRLVLLPLDGNRVSDLSPLRGMTRLETLYLGNNRISDIAPLQGLTRLRTLYLDSNRISDVSPLQNLTRLADLRLGSNRIEDIAPLAANMGLGRRDYIGLGGNPLNDAGHGIHIPALRARGVSVSAPDDTRPWAALRFGVTEPVTGPFDIAIHPSSEKRILLFKSIDPILQQRIQIDQIRFGERIEIVA